MNKEKEGKEISFGWIKWNDGENLHVISCKLLSIWKGLIGKELKFSCVTTLLFLILVCFHLCFHLENK